jgi:RES domain-containing protein
VARGIGPWSGRAYRAHHPRWAHDPLSGEGARRHGGRFNPPGLATLYTSLDLRTAWSEFQQDFVRKGQAATIVCYECRLHGVLDLTNAEVRGEWRIAWESLSCPWEYMMRIEQQIPPSQALGQWLATIPEVEAILTPSFANGAPGGTNLVLFHWNSETVTVIDDADRLPGTLGNA